MHIYIYMPVHMFTVYDDAQARLSALHVCVLVFVVCCMKECMCSGRAFLSLTNDLCPTWC